MQILQVGLWVFFLVLNPHPKRHSALFLTCKSKCPFCVFLTVGNLDPYQQKKENNKEQNLLALCQPKHTRQLWGKTCVFPMQKVRDRCKAQSVEAEKVQVLPLQWAFPCSCHPRSHAAHGTQLWHCCAGCTGSGRTAAPGSLGDLEEPTHCLLPALGTPCVWFSLPKPLPSHPTFPRVPERLRLALG